MSPAALDFPDTLLNKRWVLGAVNYDEDFHFSSYYIRASYSENAADLYPGYNNIVGFYDNFTERYYLTKEECILCSTAIIKKALSNPSWLPDVLRQIVKKTDILNGVFLPLLNQDNFATFSKYELLSLYKTHDLRNKELYLVARLPEALDRSVNYFTGFLKESLGKAGVDPSIIEDVFLKLTNPTHASILSQESLDFLKIVDLVKADLKLRSEIIDNPKRARLNLPAKVISQLKDHLSKWRYLDYHGYGGRSVATLNDYIERLISVLKDERLYEPTYRLEENLKKGQDEKEKVFEQLHLDPSLKKLFEVFPEIGAVKLYRRYGQLKNFYYLDMLLSEVGLRLGLDEHTLRYMLPEEIIACLEEDKPVDPRVYDRKNGCCIIYQDGGETIETPKNYDLAKASFDKQFKSPKSNRVLKGIIACKGKVVGSCKIMIRPDQKEMPFSKGNILVSEATDPDLLKYLKVAGGVLTEQGGVTSHAAIICRELGIPTIIGIDGLLETLKDDDVVELDANLGEVKLIPREISLPFDFLKFSEDSLEPHVIGYKAANLRRVKHLGYRVPEFVFFPIEGVKQLLTAYEKRANDIVKLHVQTELKLSSADLIAIRSSSTNEDSSKTSMAGEFESLLDIPLTNLMGALQEFVVVNANGKSGNAYSGSIIIQKMIQPDFSGVCLTSDRRIASVNALIIEAVQGSNVGITSGKIQPDRLVVLRETGDIVHELTKVQKNLDYSFLTTFAVRQFIALSQSFGSELDIEWAVKDDKLYFLQVRPIIFNEVDEINKIA